MVNPTLLTPGPAEISASGGVGFATEQIHLPLHHRHQHTPCFLFDKLMKKLGEFFFSNLLMFQLPIILSHEWFFLFEGLFFYFPLAFGRGGDPSSAFKF
jgi:hypothetical protein